MATSPPASTAVPPRLNYRVLLGSLSGSVIEWFDFLVYGTVAALVFNKLYFPTMTRLSPLSWRTFPSHLHSSLGPWVASSSPILVTESGVRRLCLSRSC